jgi:hypothetical protein
MRLGKVLLRLFIVFTLLALVMGATAPAAYAATPAEIEAAITKGLTWLASVQDADGSWSDYGNSVGHTGIALLKFETHAAFMGMSPFNPAYPYHTVVEKGLNFLFSMCTSEVIVIQPAGNPDSNGNGIGVGCPAPGGWEPFYEQGLALMAIVASNEPARLVTVGSQTGRSFFDVAVDMTDYIAFAQNESAGAPASRGGWRYEPNSWDSDNSVSGYISLALAYAEAPPPYGFSIPILNWVIIELNNFVTKVQDPVDGDSRDGGSWYVPENWDWVNILKTGNLLAEMALVGDNQSTQRVKDAVDYIERHWSDPDTDPGWGMTGAVNYQACFTTMKGFQALGIELIDLDNNGVLETNWYDEMAERIVRTQNADGSWPWDNWGDTIMTTAWAMLTLEKATPPALSLVPPFDQNPVNTSHTVTATYKIGGVPQAGVTVNFAVTAGPNMGLNGSDITDANGEATFTYTGSGGTGMDTIRATAVDQSGVPLVSSTALKDWKSAGLQVPSMTDWGLLGIVVFMTVVMMISLRRKPVRDLIR